MPYGMWPIEIMITTFCTVHGSTHNDCAHTMRSEFNTVCKILRTAKVIYGAIRSTSKFLRGSSVSPGISQDFISEFDRMVAKAWGDQQSISCNQILKGNLSISCGKAYGIFNRDNPDTRECNHFSAQVWMVKTVESLLYSTLGLWNNSCDNLHGATEAER